MAVKLSELADEVMVFQDEETPISVKDLRHGGNRTQRSRRGVGGEGGVSELKAYKVSNDEYAEIVFAETPGKAKTKTTYLDDDFIELSACRAPEFDQYIGQVLTPEIYLKHGWWLTCATCGRLVYEEFAIVVEGEVHCLEHFECEESAQ